MRTRLPREYPAVRLLRPALLAGLLGLALGWAYWPTLRALADRWSRDPQYSHGFLVPVFACIVLWYRREQCPGVLSGASWWGVPILVVAAGLRLADAYYYFEWLDFTSLVVTAAGVCVLLGGWRLLAWAWPAVALLVFMLPLPYQLEIALAQPLQRLATVASTYALQTLGLPAVAEGNVIHMDELKIGVVEACSGLAMLMTFFALSTAVAFIVQRPWHDRLAIFLSAVPVGVLINLIRITVTGLLHRTVGSEIADAVFHDLAGWLMMPLALAVLWLELQFLDRLFVHPDQSAGPLPVALPRVPPALPAPEKPDRPARAGRQEMRTLRP